MEGLIIVTIDATPQALASVLETALDAGHTYGIGYWARVEETRTEILVGGKDSKSEERIAWVRLTDHQGAGASDATDDSAYRRQRKHWPGTKDGRVVINTDDIKRAIVKMLQDPKGTESGDWGARIVKEEYPDGPMADAIIQVACFGKVIYG
jgi:hypothetical protein